MSVNTDLSFSVPWNILLNSLLQSEDCLIRGCAQKLLHMPPPSTLEYKRIENETLKPEVAILTSSKIKEYLLLLTIPRPPSGNINLLQGDN